MTVEEYISRVNRFEKEINGRLLKTLEGALLSAKALIAKRVQTQGKDADDNFFSNYSKGYKKKREDNNFNTNIKNFTYTGQLFKSLGVTFKQKEENRLVIVLEPIGTRSGTGESSNKKLLEYLEKNEGKAILELSSKELKLIETALENEVERSFNEIVGNDK